MREYSIMKRVNNQNINNAFDNYFVFKFEIKDIRHWSDLLMLSYDSEIMQFTV